MVLRYALVERAPVRTNSSPSTTDEEDVYYELMVALATRVLLTQWSERQQANLASFAGQVVRAFLARFERDPRELAMIHYVSVRLDETPVLTHEHLLDALRLCPPATGVRLPPGYFCRFQRSFVEGGL
jgi:hypothetical protein